MRTRFAILSFAMTLVSCPLLPQSDNESNFIEENMMENEIVQKPAIFMIGIDCRTSNAVEAGPQDIPRLWGKFYCEDIINQIPNKTSNEVIALYCDYEGDYTQPYSVVIGCPVSSIDTVPEGMVAKTIPGGSYAVFRAVGDYPASLIDAWGTIWQTDLKRTYTGDYELYGEKFTSGSPKEVEVFIAIESNANSMHFEVLRKEQEEMVEEW